MFVASEPCYYLAAGDETEFVVYRSPMVRWDRSRLLADVRGFIAEHGLSLVESSEAGDDQMFYARGITEVYR